MMRALRQQLESLSLAGLTHLPRGEAPVGETLPHSVTSPLSAPAVAVRTPPAPVQPPTTEHMAKKETAGSVKAMPLEKAKSHPAGDGRGAHRRADLPLADSPGDAKQALAV